MVVKPTLGNWVNCKRFKSRSCNTINLVKPTLGNWVNCKNIYQKGIHISLGETDFEGLG